MGKRKEIIYNSQTKVKITQRIIDNNDRCLIFTGLQKIADQLGEASFHSKANKENLTKFIDFFIFKLS